MSVELKPPSQDAKAQFVKISFSLAMIPSAPSTISELGIDTAAQRLADIHLALARQEHGQLFSRTSQAVDTVVSIETSAQAEADVAKGLDSEQVIGAMVKCLDAVVSVGDEISKAGSHRLRLRWRSSYHRT